jgi:hypothetical protein
MPYFENYPSTYEPDKSVQEILSLVERDLLQAKNLVAPFDTLPDKSMLVAEKRIKNNWVSSSVTDLFRSFVPADTVEEQWDLDALNDKLKSGFGIEIDFKKMLDADTATTDEDLLINWVFLWKSRWH